MKTKTYYILVVLYLLATAVLMFYSSKTTKYTKYEFLLVGLVGQVMLYAISYHIYKSQQMWSSVYLYAVMYVLYILSFTSIDIYFYLENAMNFTGKIFRAIHRMFIDFLYLNFSTVSTMGIGDISPNTTTTRAYSSYKIAVAIFMIVFLVSDITIKTK